MFVCKQMVKVFTDYCNSIDYKLNSMDLANALQFLPTLIEAVSDAIRVTFVHKDRRPEINLNLEKLKKKKVNFRVHCGIDFGTAGSGMSFIMYFFALIFSQK